MKKFACMICVLVMLLSVFPISASAATLTTKEKDGISYIRVNTKEEYYAAARKAIEANEEQIYVYYEESKREWDDSYSNDGRNFTGHGTRLQYDTYVDYNADSVWITAYPEILENPDGSGTPTGFYYGTIGVSYCDTKEELAKADALIRSVLAGISSKSTVDQLKYVTDYICKKAYDSGEEMPGGGWDQVNGVYDVLTDVHTNTVCASYALSTKRFLDIMGVENTLLSNYSHVWNMVKLEGKWYGLDLAYEESEPGDGMPEEYFLMGYDRVKGYDWEKAAPVAMFMKTHTIAPTQYGAAAATTTTAQNGKTTTKTAGTTKATQKDR